MQGGGESSLTFSTQDDTSASFHVLDVHSVDDISQGGRSATGTSRSGRNGRSMYPSFLRNMCLPRGGRGFNTTVYLDIEGVTGGRVMEANKKRSRVSRRRLAAFIDLFGLRVPQTYNQGMEPLETWESRVCKMQIDYAGVRKTVEIEVTGYVCRKGWSMWDALINFR